MEAETFHAFTTVMTEMRDIYIRNLEDAEIGLYVSKFVLFTSSLLHSYSFTSKGILDRFQHHIDCYLPSTAEYLVLLYFSTHSSLLHSTPTTYPFILSSFFILLILFDHSRTISTSILNSTPFAG